MNFRDFYPPKKLKAIYLIFTIKYKNKHETFTQTM